MSIGTMDIVALLATGTPPPVNGLAVQAVLFMVSTLYYCLVYNGVV